MRSFKSKLRITFDQGKMLCYIYQCVLITYIIIVGNYQKAEKLYSKLLKRFRVNLGESHPNTFFAMNFLAKCYNHHGKYTEAEVLYKQCLDKMKVVVNKSHPCFLVAMSGLADTYGFQGKYKEAEDLYKQCLDKMKVVVGDNHMLSVSG